MAITRKRDKDGNIIGYVIRVYSGSTKGDDGERERNKPHTLYWKPEPGMTLNQMEKEAKAQEVRFKDSLQKGYQLDNKQIFSEYAKYVLQCKRENGIKKKTLDRYEDLLVRINEGIGHIQLVDITPQHLNMLYSQLRKPGVRKGTGRAYPITDIKAAVKECGMTKVKLSEVSGISQTTINTAYNGESISEQSANAICAALSVPVKKLFRIEVDDTPLSDKTILEYHRLIYTILKQADQEMLIPFNPADKIVNKPNQGRKPEVNYLELDELRSVLKCADKEPIKWKTMVYTLVATAGRRGEMFGLKWSDIDFNKKTIHIHNNILYSPDYGIYEDTTKTVQSDRTLKLSDKYVNVFKEYRAYWEQLRIDYGDTWNTFITIKDGKGKEHTEPADFLFIREDKGKAGYPMHPDSLNDWLYKFSARYNLPHLNPHAFRHTMISLLLLNGADLETTSEIAGHATGAFTLDKYGHIHEKGKDKAANIMSSIAFPLEESNEDSAEEKNA